MILLALALQAAASQTAVEAERAFAAGAQAEGQWTAFRRFATDDAIMFTPRPTNAQDWLKDRADPPRSVEWWPTESYVSCDGKVAVNTGGWKRPDGSVGYFTTVWKRQSDGGWKWVLDHGDALATPRAGPDTLRIRQAICEGKTKPFLSITSATGPGVLYANGESADHSIAWSWIVERDNARTLNISFWNGRAYEDVIEDKVTAPK